MMKKYTLSFVGGVLTKTDGDFWLGAEEK